MTSFEGGSMAGIPLCCQQRPVPRTLRWQGVPFCVRAPQIETTSPGSVGLSVAVPSGPYRGSGFGASAEESSPLASPLSAGVASPPVFAAGSSPRSTIKGGGSGRIERPAASPIESSNAPNSTGAAIPDLRNRFSQLWQKRRLFQMRQRARRIFAPHSAQKFGLYIRRAPFV
jgi:hypothetical protein